MSKNILIFSDGTGQYGGQRPDQRLSNIYKMYRAMRPGPDSPIRYSDQIAYYDPGLGAGEVEGMSWRKLRNALEAAVGTGIDENVIDCYEKILEYYQPGDRILLFGFSRGAYTVRSLANVMNLCGVPTRTPDWKPLPTSGPKLRAIAREAVRKVYGHGAGKRRAEEPYRSQREEKGRRFREKYGSAPPPGLPDVQGNVQPDFIGVFDTVAALGNALVFQVFQFALIAIGVLAGAAWNNGASNWILWPLLGLLGFGCLWWLWAIARQFRYFEPNPDKPLRWYHPLEAWRMRGYTHFARWNRKHYDMWLDSDVGYARHALSIDESRKNFPRVEWGSAGEVTKNSHKTNPVWLNQVWFAGCHSDIGGSYPEAESRLSDIALEWMLGELRACYPTVQVRRDMLVTNPDPLARQHEERFIGGKFRIFRWRTRPREVHPDHRLHSSVIERLQADQVPHPEEIRPYRPEQLRNHPQAAPYYPAPRTETPPEADLHTTNR